MFIKVRLIKNSSKPLLYSIPGKWENLNIVGSIIKVPLRNKTTWALVEEHIKELPVKPDFKIKEALEIQNFPQDQYYSKFIDELARYYQIEPIYLISRMHQFIKQDVKKDTELDIIEQKFEQDKLVNLTEEQQNIVNFLKPKIINSEYCPTLLHGVTGSGKTEVYKKLITHAIQQNKTAILLLPEVTMAIQFENLLKFSLKNISIFGFHSSSTPKTKRELWNSLLDNKPILIIGVHLPILLPINNLGIIIVDEEHEVGYQEKKHPKINTKEATILRASLNNIPILLGSATPSISSLNNVQKLQWNFFQLKQRFGGEFAKVEVVNLNDKKQRKNFWINPKLEKLIIDRLAKKEQSIIFINRRGFSFFVQCKNCNFIFKCKNCSVSLVLHENNLLYCHYCALSNSYPKNCLDCKSTDFLKKGIGTEQVVTILQKMFPYACIERADMEITSKKKKWKETLENFHQGKIDILVGTQTITKGYHFPNVTLVGVLWADLNLHFPMFNACEKTLQQLIQVAGRAGRAKKNSDVIIQTMTDHPIYNYLNEVDYLQFYSYEIEKRRESNYPPCTRLVEIEFKNKDETVVDLESKRFKQEITQKSDPNVIIILGPVKPPVSRIKNQNFRKIYIKSNNINIVINLFKNLDKNSYKSEIYFTPNPIN